MKSGGVPERSIGADCKSANPSGLAGSNPATAAIFATGTEALTSAPVFNHTQPRLHGPMQAKLYRPVCVSQIGARQWTNNRKENKEGL